MRWSAALAVVLLVGIAGALRPGTWKELEALAVPPWWVWFLATFFCGPAFAKAIADGFRSILREELFRALQRDRDERSN